MTLRHLRIFVEVCRTGSITKAAESLHLSQPAVSLAIPTAGGILWNSLIRPDLQKVVSDRIGQ